VCAIAGIWTRGGAPVDHARLLRLRDAMRTRGPDDAGALVAGDLALAHRRLSIVDLSAAGRQPLANEDGRVQVVFNGEIYNHVALRAALRGRGHRFASRTDGEVLVHAWEEWGPGLLERLNGMFAFALWDAADRRLVLARDRLGVKPLYVLEHGRTIAFASEVQALAAAFPEAVSLDWRAIDAYLHFGFVPQDLGVYREIRALPPAHVLDVTEGDVRLRRWWALRFGAPAAPGPGGWRPALRTVLRAAVERRLAADVRVGVLLSGGVDSSVVAALACESGAAPPAFTVAFEGAAADPGSDLCAARAVARRLGLRHRELVLGDEAAEAVDRLVAAFGVPFGDASAVPTYFAGRLAADAGAKVLLTGDGGDEVFGGYAHIQAAYLGWLCRRAAGRLPGGAALLGAAAALAGRAPRRPRLASRVATVLGYAAALDRGLRWTDGWYGDALRAVRGPALRDAGPAEDADALLAGHGAAAAASTGVERLIHAGLAVVLPGAYLVKVDVGLMASSVEGRSPFLDVEAMEFGARMPLGVKLSPLRPKHLLKRLALDLGLPRAAMLRPKRGFGAPVAAWLRGPLRDRARDCLLGTLPARGVVDARTVRRAWDDHQSGRADVATRLWLLFCLELWFRTFVDGEAPRLVRASA
jgi:asparagine synthase (glutamine-hydrolysing)